MRTKKVFVYINLFSPNITRKVEVVSEVRGDRDCAMITFADHSGIRLGPEAGKLKEGDVLEVFYLGHGGVGSTPLGAWGRRTWRGRKFYPAILG